MKSKPIPPIRCPSIGCYNLLALPAMFAKGNIWSTEGYITIKCGVCKKGSVQFPIPKPDVIEALS